MPTTTPRFGNRAALIVDVKFGLSAILALREAGFRPLSNSGDLGYLIATAAPPFAECLAFQECGHEQIHSRTHQVVDRSDHRSGRDRRILLQLMQD